MTRPAYHRDLALLLLLALGAGACTGASVVVEDRDSPAMAWEPCEGLALAGPYPR